MKKSLIALAVASVFIAPAALAQVTVYGQANAAIQSHDDGKGTTTTKVGNGASRLGFRGTEAVNADLSAFFQVETSILLDDAKNDVDTKLGDRTSHVGLRSKSMGAVSLGNVNTPYKSASRRLDMFGDSPADTRETFKIHSGDIGNAVMYVSPAMGGLSVAVAKKFGEAANAAATTSMAAMYDVQPFYATIAHSKHYSPTSPTDREGVQVGGGYTTDAFAVSLVYERLTDTTSNVDTTSRNVAVNAKYNISKANTVKLGYITKGDTTKAGDATLNNGNRQVAVGFDHRLSKQTSVGLLYAKRGNDADVDTSVIHLGLGHSF